MDDLIEFAVSEANRALVPQGIAREHWERLMPAERFYLKLIELEARGQRTLDNYQNFAKAFKVRDFKPFMASERANAARLKGATEFGRSEMGETSELYDTPLRGVLYALMELEKNVDGEDVLNAPGAELSGATTTSGSGWWRSRGTWRGSWRRCGRMRPSAARGAAGPGAESRM